MRHPAPAISMQFLLKNSKMNSFFWFETPIDDKTWKNNYFLTTFCYCFNLSIKLGPCFLARGLTKPHIFSSIGASNQKKEFIFELFRKFCPDIAGDTGLILFIWKRLPPYEEKTMKSTSFLVICSHFMTLPANVAFNSLSSKRLKK